MKFLFTEGLAPRLSIFLICVALVLAMCALHGYYDGKRTGRILDEMAEQGHFTGRFWRVVERGGGRIVLTKFNRSLLLYTLAPEDLRPGDHVSFIARKLEGGNSPQQEWEAMQSRFHGTSTGKFLVSAVALFAVLFLLWRHLRPEKRSRSLVFRGGEEPCPMD